MKFLQSEDFKNIFNNIGLVDRAKLWAAIRTQTFQKQTAPSQQDFTQYLLSRNIINNQIIEEFQASQIKRPAPSPTRKETNLKKKKKTKDETTLLTVPNDEEFFFSPQPSPETDPLVRCTPPSPSYWETDVLLGEKLQEEQAHEEEKVQEEQAHKEEKVQEEQAHEEEIEQEGAVAQEETLSENQQRILQLLEKEGKRSWTNIRLTLSKQKVSYSKHPLREDLENLVSVGLLKYEEVQNKGQMSCYWYLPEDDG